MAVSINGIAIPATINNRGIYVYVPHTVVRIAGDGRSVTAGTARATWQFSSLSQSAWAWWNVTLLAGAASMSGAARLWDENDAEQDFDYVVVRAPTYQRLTNGYHWDVEIVIDTMIQS
jgi:hypothetical protein